MTRLRLAPEAARLDELIDLYQQIAGMPDEVAQIESRIMNVPELRALSAFVIVLWYTGDLLGKQLAPATEDEYFGGILWKIARAHPPGLSGGYFGHWTYPPDNS